MPSRSLASALKDFGARSMPAAEPFFMPPAMSEPVFEMPSFASEPVAEPFDATAMVEEAVAEAERALTLRLEQLHDAAIQAERERHAEEIAELQRHLAVEASAQIQARIAEMERRVTELTSAVTARILGAMLTDDMRGRSVARLAETIREAMRDDEAVRIRVRGSLPLFEALQTAMPDHADQLNFTESATFDLSVTIDDSVYETRLAEWSAALAEALS